MLATKIQLERAQEGLSFYLIFENVTVFDFLRFLWPTQQRVLICRIFHTNQELQQRCLEEYHRGLGNYEPVIK